MTDKPMPVPGGKMDGNAFLPLHGPDCGEDSCCEQSVTLHGTLHQKYRWEQRTHTMLVALPPMTEADMHAAVIATCTGWEAQGFRIQAHSLVDTGGGWTMFLTVGWDQCVECLPLRPNPGPE